MTRRVEFEVSKTDSKVTTVKGYKLFGVFGIHNTGNRQWAVVHLPTKLSLHALFYFNSKKDAIEAAKRAHKIQSMDWTSGNLKKEVELFPTGWNPYYVEVLKGRATPEEFDIWVVTEKLKNS